MSSRYERACDKGYDGPNPAELRRSRRRNSCLDGMCGALDCYRCRPDSAETCGECGAQRCNCDCEVGDEL